MFSEKLIELRKKRKMSQRDLAKLLNLTHTAIGKYERNEAEPNLTTLRRLSVIFEVSVDYLLEMESISPEMILVRKKDWDQLQSYLGKTQKIIQRY